MAEREGFEPLLEGWRYQPPKRLSEPFGRPLREEARNIHARLVGIFGFGNFVPGAYTPVLEKR